MKTLESTAPADRTEPAPASELPGEDLREARPASGIEHAAMRASLRHKLFGVAQEPLRLGRFVLMERLGQGGMSVVYSAYDPHLDRRVALKLLRPGHRHTGEQAKDRLLREAQALARLSHPNVVPVYEVGLVDDQVFIVMEFVVGTTLRKWMTAADRTWRQVLDAFREAGQGLAAAHAVGLVHRDFKPDNVQVGDDGRIRVLDFGLVRGHTEDEAERTPTRPPDLGDRVSSVDGMEDTEAAPGPGGADESGEPGAQRADELRSNKGLNTPLTATGALLGTPAYMPLEQFDGAQVGPASDQFSFCVSLYEGLYGQRPFAGDTVRELRASMRAGQIRPPPRASRVPRWVFLALCRGLSTEPAQRYPSMRALLTALGRDPARTRARAALVASIAGLVAVSIYAFTLGRPADSVCQGGARELSVVWGPQRRAALRRAFQATGREYAGQAWARVAAGLDGYADAWTDMHQEACRAHQRGEQSGVLLDKRMACLARRKSALANAVEVLGEIDAAALGHSVDVVQKLPAIASCANLDALAAEVPPPEDPEVAARVDALRTRLARAVALEDAGRYGDALALATTLAAEAEHLGYRPAWAEVTLVQGRITLAMGDGEAAARLLRRATALGLATGVYEIALEALARGIYAEATSSDDPRFDPGQVLRPMYMAEALLEQVPEPSFVHALLLNNAGVVHLARGDREQARATFERALEVKRRARGTPNIELSSVLSNLALVTPELDRRAVLAASATREAELALGPVHPRTLMLRYVEGTHTLAPARAHEILAGTCDAYQRYHPELREQLAGCLYQLAALDLELGDRARASHRLIQAAALFPDHDRAWRRDLARAQGLAYGGAPGALDALQQGLRELGADPEQWWNRQWMAESLLAEGTALVALGRSAAAVAALERALRAFEQVVEISGNVAARRGLARTRVALATVLSEMRPADRRARAADLMSRALSWYHTAGAGNERQRDEIAAWLEARGVAAERAPAGALR